MKYINFVNRVSELGLLEKWLGKPGSKLIILYGRRRVGKTALLREFTTRHGGIYLVARQGNAMDQLNHLSTQLARFFGEELVEINPFRSWDALLMFISERAQNLPVIIDEFPYLVQSTKELPSILQEYWDTRFSASEICLVLCGSSLSMMESLLGYKSPIYGRRTGQLLLEPLGFQDAQHFHPSLPPSTRVEVYAALGGTPAYLLEFDETKSLMQNIKELVLKKHSFMSQDVEFVLREELNEPRHYFSIIHSVSKGNTTMGRIANDTGLDKGTVSKYIHVLIDLHVLERRVPITEPRPRKSRKGIYMIKDNYFKFWFRYVFANPQYIEQGLHDILITEKIAPDFNAFVGKAFEDICIDWMKRVKPKYLVGRWWDKREEIDVVCINTIESHAILAEVKWSTLERKDVVAILSALEKKGELVNTGCVNVDHVVIAKKIIGKQALTREGMTVHDLDDITAGSGFA